MNSIIRDAINGKRLIRFSYNGLPRTVEPFTYGLTAAGHEVMRGVQVDGQSGSSSALGWRVFTVTEMVDLAETPVHFDPSAREDYNPVDPVIVEMFASIDPGNVRAA